MRPHADSHPKGLDVDRFSAGIVETLSTSKIIPKALRPHLDFINQGIAVIAAALKALAPYAERASALVVHIWTFADQNKLFDFVSFACGYVSAMRFARYRHLNEPFVHFFQFCNAVFRWIICASHRSCGGVPDQRMDPYA